MVDETRTRPKDRRESILAAATTRFYQRGYAGTSLEDIAGDLGVTAPALYRHFRNKDALYTATLETNLRHLERCIAEATSAESAIGGLASVAVEYPTLGLLWNTDRRRRLVDPDGAIQARLAAAADDLGALFEGEASPELARLLARAALAAASSTGFYVAGLDSEQQRRQLEVALSAVARFVPTEPLVALAASDDDFVNRPWETRRSALLDAGALLIVQRGGYQAVTIEEIAAAVGVGPNTVYLHFSGKADLFAAVLRRAANWLSASLQQAAAQAVSPDDALRLAVSSSLELSAQHPSWTGSLADELANLPEEHIRDVVAIADEYLAGWLALCAAVTPMLTLDEVQVRMRAALAVLDDRAMEAVDRRVLSIQDSVSLTRTILTS